jgi:nucleoside-diphosphate-sugar epimerase
MPDRAQWNVLITGACGMVGSHMYERLQAECASVTGTYTKPTTDLRELPCADRLVEMDVRYGQHVMEVIERLRPTVIFHLAAQSYPTVSWERPQETLETNVVGTANVFEAVRALRRRSPAYDPVVVVASSSASYGASLLTSDGPITEDAALLPLHPYGVSKAATDLLAFQYWKSDGIRSIRARIFNCSGPRKKGDVVSDFARRIAALPPEGGTLRVGNLRTRRAFLHVADLIEALIGLAQKGAPGEAYNISGEEVVEVGALLPMFEAISGKRALPDVDTSLLRPTDEPVIAGDNTRLRRRTGWMPLRRVRDIVDDVYADAAWRVATASAAAATPLPPAIRRAAILGDPRLGLALRSLAGQHADRPAAS